MTAKPAMRAKSERVGAEIKTKKASSLAKSNMRAWRKMKLIEKANKQRSLKMIYDEILWRISTKRERARTFWLWNIFSASFDSFVRNYFWLKIVAHWMEAASKLTEILSSIKLTEKLDSTRLTSTWWSHFSRF